MSDIDTARLRELALKARDLHWRSTAYEDAVGPHAILRLLDRIDSLERTAAAAGRALREANEREAQASHEMRWRISEYIRCDFNHADLARRIREYKLPGDDIDAIAAKEQSNG